MPTAYPAFSRIRPWREWSLPFTVARCNCSRNRSAVAHDVTRSRGQVEIGLKAKGKKRAGVDCDANDCAFRLLFIDCGYGSCGMRRSWWARLQRTKRSLRWMGRYRQNLRQSSDNPLHARKGLDRLRRSG